MSADNNFDLTELGEGNLDLESIFGGIAGGGQNLFSAPPTPQPMTAPVVAVAAPQQEYPVAVQPIQPVPVPVVAPVPIAAPMAAPMAAPTPVETAAPVADNPIAAAFGVQEEAFAAQTAQSLFEKLPVFSYGGATESIEDGAQTFEELRIAKADDFPELSEGKKVTWTVDYGKVSKTIADPKTVTIASIKTEIEQSKAFLDALKKAKDKDRNPDCLVKPKVAAQSKGIASYKGVFPTLEEARASDKVICLIPSQDGRVYEMRRNELGEFIAPATNVVDFLQVGAGFTPALPRIPFALLQEIIAFFRKLTLHKQDTVAFYVLEQYEIAPAMPQAA